MPLVLAQGLRFNAVQLGALVQFTLLRAALMTEMMFFELSTLPESAFTSARNDRCCRCGLSFVTTTEVPTTVEASMLSYTCRVQFSCMPRSSDPAGSVEPEYENSDLLTITRLLRLVEDSNPNWYVSGRSGSVH